MISFRRFGLIAACASCALASVLPMAAQTNYAAERAERAQELSQPFGWVSLVALEHLKPGVTTVGSAKENTLVLEHAPAHLLELEAANGTVSVRAADPSLKLRGESVPHGTKLSAAEDDGSALTSGSLKLWVIQRGDQRYLRVKDSEAPALKHFHPLLWYAPNPRYRVTAEWVPDAVPHKLRVVNKLGQVSDVSVPGHVEFELDGQKQSLVPLVANADSLWFVFRDQTYLTDTDQGGRFLTVKAPRTGLARGGELEIDFNEAVNPPCAYSPYATCPLASAENRLTVAIPAGEKRYEP
jgi:uncharacterized protein (DUF1684 family)